MVASGVFQVELSGGDEAIGVTFNPLGSSIKNMRKAQCIDGVLFVSDQTGTPFVDQGCSFTDGNYQCLDYPIYHRDSERTRRNASWCISIYPVRARSLILLERPSVHQLEKQSTRKDSAL